MGPTLPAPQGVKHGDEPVERPGRRKESKEDHVIDAPLTITQ